MKSEKFSYIELIIILVIVTILSIASIGLYKDYLEDQRLIECIDKVDKKWKAKEIANLDIKDEKLKECRKKDNNDSTFLSNILEIVESN